MPNNFARNTTDVITDSEITIDTTLLRNVTQRRLRKWFVIGPVLFCLLVAVQLFIFGQTYEALASVAVQQSSPTSTLSLFTGQSASKKYIGILQSRMLAERVEKKYSLQNFYHLPNYNASINKLMDSVRPEDNATTGLLIVHVTLPGPPRYGPDPEGRRLKVRHLVADVANAYITDLRSYYATSDNDRDSVLLKAAQVELHNARVRFNTKSQALLAFVRDLGHVSPMSAPMSSGDPTASSESMSSTDAVTGGPGVLTTLYDKAIQTLAEIRRTEASEEGVTSGVKRLVGDLSNLPSDDPFLRSARERVASAQRNYNYLLNAEQLASENPRVIAAKHRLEDAQADLNRQKQATLNQLSSDRVEADTRLQGLRAEYATLQESIVEAERKLPTKRELAAELELMKGEQSIALEHLKAAEVKGAELRLSAVSGQSMISVVDEAIPAESGQPGPFRVVIISLIIILLLLIVNIIWEYSRQSRHRTLFPMQLSEAPDNQKQETPHHTLASKENQPLIKTKRGAGRPN